MTLLSHLARMLRLPAWALLACLAWGAAGELSAATRNGGQGPFSVRNLYPPVLPYLDFVPGQPLTLEPSSLEFLYRYTVSNAYFNTLSPGRSGITDPVTQDDVDAGLTAADFQATGYGIYMDVETERHQFSFRYGLLDNVEVGVELGWVSMGGGGLDPLILQVETLGNVVNEHLEFVEDNRFDYYLYYNGQEVHAATEPFQFAALDPVFTAKWNLGQGGEFLPALSLSASYKLPLDSSPELPRSLVSSGEPDWGWSVLLAKRFVDLVAYYQFGQLKLSVPGDAFESRRTFRMFGLELDTGNDAAWVVQVTGQTGLFHRPDEDNFSAGELNLSRPVDLIVAGFKSGGDTGLRYEVGIIEDLNSVFNEIDVALFLALGWRW